MTMIYEVSRFCYQVPAAGKIVPGWQTVFIGALNPEEALAKAMPILESAEDVRNPDPAEVKVASCPRHRRYQAVNPPTGNCGRCHAIYEAGLKWSREAASTDPPADR